MKLVTSADIRGAVWGGIVGLVFGYLVAGVDGPFAPKAEILWNESASDQPFPGCDSSAGCTTTQILIYNSGNAPARYVQVGFSEPVFNLALSSSIGADLSRNKATLTVPVIGPNSFVEIEVAKPSNAAVKRVMLDGYEAERRSLDVLPKHNSWRRLFLTGSILIGLVSIIGLAISSVAAWIIRRELELIKDKLTVRIKSPESSGADPKK